MQTLNSTDHSLMETKLHLKKNTNFINKGITVEQILKQLFLAASTALFF